MIGLVITALSARCMQGSAEETLFYCMCGCVCVCEAAPCGHAVHSNDRADRLAGGCSAALSLSPSLNPEALSVKPLHSSSSSSSTIDRFTVSFQEVVINVSSVAVTRVKRTRADSSRPLERPWSQYRLNSHAQHTLT